MNIRKVKIINTLFTLIAGFSVGSAYWLTDWQFWTILICFIGTYFCGRYIGAHNNND